MDLRKFIMTTCAFLALGAGSLQAQASQVVLAGGCFWCVEADLEKVAGVLEVESGYTGGTLENPTYKQVSAGGTGHYEAVRVEFDSDVIDLKQLLKKFWTLVDPYDAQGQFCDKGLQYRSAIFFADSSQEKVARASRAKLVAGGGQEVATQVLPLGRFYPAEDYHQNYYKTHPWRYRLYRYNCGRDARLAELAATKKLQK